MGLGGDSNKMSGLQTGSHRRKLFLHEREIAQIGALETQALPLNNDAPFGLSLVLDWPRGDGRVSSGYGRQATIRTLIRTRE